MSRPLVVAVVGATATGKSALGLALARALDGEVVNADSMQLYRGMDVGTGKLAPSQRGGVAHHLLDIWAVSEPASVADYQRRARRCVDDLLARGRSAVVVGGSGLYVQALLDDLRFPRTDPQLRAELEAELAAVGAPALHARLAARDPAAAERILASNGRRIVRALEVVELAGSFSATLPRGRAHYPAVQVGLDLPPEELDRRIEARVEAMLAAGWVEEVRRLAAAGLRAGPTASRALGYRELLAHLDGALALPAARERTVARTRRFARRQRSWFRRDQRIEWFPADAGQLDRRVLAHLTAGRMARPGHGGAGG